MKDVLFTKLMRGLSIKEVARRTKALGFSAVEFPVRGEFESNLKNVHRTLPPVAQRLRSEGIDITLVASDIQQADTREGEYLYEACQRAGAPFVRPGYWFVQGLNYWEKYDWAVRQLQTLQKLSEKHGVKTLIHIHSGKLLSANCSSTYMLIKECDPQYVGIYWDPGHMAADGEDYEMGLGIVQRYLSGVAVKNCCYVKTGESPTEGACWELRWVPLREGLVPWAKVIGLLKTIGYSGFLSFHAEYAEQERAEQLVAEDLKFIRSIIGGPTKKQ